MPCSQPHLVIAAVAAFLGGTAYANPAIAWYSIDGGGTVSSNGGTVLWGVIAQPDAGVPQSGGLYELRGGFLAPPLFSRSPCGPAALAEPYEIIDLADINAFVASFVAMEPPADIDANGIYDLGDINGFVSAFLAGCP